MVSILPAERSSWDVIGNAIGQNLNQTLPQIMQQHHQQSLLNQQMQERKKSVTEQFGPEIANLPPDVQKILIEDVLKGKQKQKEQDFLSQIFGSGQGQQNNPQNGGQGPSTQFNPADISDADIAKATSVNPNLGKLLQQQKDVGLREKRAQEESEAKEKRHTEDIDYQSFKDNKDYIEKVLGGLEGYKRDKMVLDQMETLASRGNLPKPITTSLLNKLGIPLGILENPDAEQFEKLSQELMKNIQGTYGSRILQSEVQSFMRSIPTLLNSPEGQKKLINQWKVLNQGKKIYYDAYKDIKKENPERLPRDLHEQVLERSESKLDELSDKFKSMNESSFIRMKGPDGKIRMIPPDMVEKATQAGGELIQ